MNTARFAVALILLMSWPPGVLLWVFIHPLASFWRKLGPVWTYTILAPPALALMIAVFAFRRVLLATDYGTSVPLIALAVVSMATGAVIAVKRRKLLTTAILAGIPEVSARRYPGVLLTEGIYGTIRHPRYVEAMCWVLGYTLFANFLATYMLLLASLPVLFVVVLLEEREPARALRRRVRGVRSPRAPLRPTAIRLSGHAAGSPTGSLMGAHRRLWTCPECGHRFVTKNLWHSCGRYRLSDHFADKDPMVRKLFQHLRRLVRACGPTTVYAQKTRIVFQGRVRFAGVVARRRWLDVGLWLARRVTHPTLQRVEGVAPLCYGHFFRFHALEEFDAAFTALLAEAYAIGQQEHLARGAAHRRAR